MDLGAYIDFRAAGLLGLASWGFALALGLKIASTVFGLRLRARGAAALQLPGVIWWASKLSAIAVCGAAALLCHLARDASGRALFLGLGAVAAGLVGGLARRRVLHKLNEAGVRPAS